MTRLLLPFLFLAALSACGQQPDDTAPATNPEEHAEADARTAWDLPWRALAVPVCLVGGTADNYSLHEELIDDLIELSEQDPEEFERLLLDDEPDTPLIERILAIVSAPDSWPASLQVRVMRRHSRSLVLRRESVLGPDMLVLPWPFPNDSLTGFRLRDRARTLGFEHRIESAPAVTGPNFYLDRLLAIADTLVMPLISGEDPLEPIKDDPAAVKEAIIARVRWHPDYTESAAPFPGTPLHVSVQCSNPNGPNPGDCWPTDSTRVRYDPTGLAGIYVELGWDPDRKPKTMGILYPNWPCDALRQYGFPAGR